VTLAALTRRATLSSTRHPGIRVDRRGSLIIAPRVRRCSIAVAIDTIVQWFDVRDGAKILVRAALDSREQVCGVTFDIRNEECT